MEKVKSIVQSSKGMPEMLTRKELRKKRGSSTAGRDKGENCHATALDKAMAKYPRSHRTLSDEYTAWIDRKQRYSKGS